MVKCLKIQISRLLSLHFSCRKNFENFVKLSGHTCSCNDLTNFEYQVLAMTGNGNYVKVTIVTAAQFFPVNLGKTKW